MPRQRDIDEPVTLTRIYTRSGDAGQTRLADGTRVAKHDVRVEAYGAVDELNAALGLAQAAADVPAPVRGIIDRVQNELFDLGADLAVPLGGDGGGRTRLRIEPGQVAWLEHVCDQVNAGLPKLFSFVLPGGAEAAARLHLARTACRGAERRAVALADHADVNPAALA